MPQPVFAVIDDTIRHGTVRSILPYCLDARRRL